MNHHTDSRPETKLDDTKLYETHNGRITCGSVKCAGMTAAYTGKTTEGVTLREVTLADNYRFLYELGEPCRCTSCGRLFAERTKLTLIDGTEVRELWARIAYKRKGTTVVHTLMGTKGSYGDAGLTKMEFRSAELAACFMALYPGARVPSWSRFVVVPA